MMEFIKNKLNTSICKFLRDENGLGTVEIVIITAVLVGLALLFREQILKLLNTIMGKTFESAESILGCIFLK